MLSAKFVEILYSFAEVGKAQLEAQSALFFIMKHCGG